MYEDHDRENGQVAEARQNRPAQARREGEVMTSHRAYLLLLLFAVAGLSSWQACADEARGLVTIGMQRVFEDVKPAYEAASGRKLNVEFASTQDIVRRMQGAARRLPHNVACRRRPSDQGRETGCGE